MLGAAAAKLYAKVRAGEGDAALAKARSNAGSSNIPGGCCVSLKLRRITANFRKLDAPVTIDGLSDGLGIVTEPKETGKSTLLEAIRAAFFVPHRAGNQPTCPYEPFGENVAHRVDVVFDAAGCDGRLPNAFFNQRQKR